MRNRQALTESDFSPNVLGEWGREFSWFMWYRVSISSAHDPLLAAEVGVGAARPATPSGVQALELRRRPTKASEERQSEDWPLHKERMARGTLAAG